MNNEAVLFIESIYSNLRKSATIETYQAAPLPSIIPLKYYSLLYYVNRRAFGESEISVLLRAIPTEEAYK